MSQSHGNFFSQEKCNMLWNFWKEKRPSLGKVFKNKNSNSNFLKFEKAARQVKLKLLQWNYLLNPFSTNVPLLYALRFSDVSRGYRSGTLIENGLNYWLSNFLKYFSWSSWVWINLSGIKATVLCSYFHCLGLVITGGNDNVILVFDYNSPGND